MTEEQKSAYLAAVYYVDLPGGRITIPASGPSDALRKLHAAKGVRGSAFVTAWNARGELTPRGVNDIAQQQLLRFVTGRWEFFPGAGTDPKGLWPEEPSLLVLGISREEAVALGRQFQQVAILFANEQGDVELLAL
ncbi:MAG: DUF3293 domain-containing protein [Candidatus Sumerlaeia bacterium]|nr:DUF3293 domain-containing protein [Candidatus Sumerlaeia bacterium]